MPIFSCSACSLVRQKSLKIMILNEKFKALTDI